MDQSGSLDKDEVAELSQKLGKKVPAPPLRFGRRFSRTAGRVSRNV